MIVEELILRVRAVVGPEVPKIEPKVTKIKTAASDAAAALFAMGAALGALTIASARSVRQNERLAAGLGESLQTVQALDYTFRALGADENDLADALTTISDRAEDAKSGMQSFIDDFALVGIAVDDLRDKSPAELFDLLIEKSGQTADANKRVTASVRLFGDDLGRRLIPLMAEGTAGLEKFKRQAADLGIVLSDEGAKGATEFAYRVDRLITRVGALARGLGLRLIPAGERLVKEFSRILDVLQPLITDGFDALAWSIEEAAKAMETPAGRIIALIGGGFAGAGLYGALARAAAMLPIVGPALVGLGSAMSALALPAAVVVGAALAIDDLNAAAEGTPSVIGAFAAALGDEGGLQATLKAVKDLLGEVTESIGTMSRAMGAALSDSLGPLGDALDMVVKNFDYLWRMSGVGTLAKMAGEGITQGRANIRKATRGFDLYNRYSSGDEFVTMTDAAWQRSDMSTADNGANRFSAPLWAARQAREEVIMSQGAPVGRGGYSPNVSVTVQAGPSPDEIARAAGRETERQVRTALAEAGG